MAKDPAFLFYPQDFIMGCLFMTNEEVGIYIRLLSAQHQQGGLINKNNFNATVGDHKLVRDKFIETEDGFYNERLMKEIVKRTKKSSNLSANAVKRWDIEKQRQCKGNAIALDADMPAEDVNENVNENNIIDGDKIQTLWIRTFGRNPKIPEIEMTEKFIEKFGEDKTYKIFKEASLSNFHSIKTLWENIDEQGNIKPKTDLKKEGRSIEYNPA